MHFITLVTVLNVQDIMAAKMGPPTANLTLAYVDKDRHQSSFRIDRNSDYVYCGTSVQPATWDSGVGITSVFDQWGYDGKHGCPWAMASVVSSDHYAGEPKLFSLSVIQLAFNVTLVGEALMMNHWVSCLGRGVANMDGCDGSWDKEGALIFSQAGSCHNVTCTNGDCSRTGPYWSLCYNGYD